jgi:flagellar biosynthesis chaperone FliJ
MRSAKFIKEARNMANQKIEKAKTEIDKAKAKISDWQAKLRELEREKTRLENEQIVALVRSEKISDAELGALMKSFRKEGPAKAKVSERITRQEEPRNANFDE